ncbi:MBL fold metallo-hydrolase [Rhodococcus sp. D2-41]|uniref:MBL fold metallo-hydrolase n=1 Tax=Speluncibacter jeojiensis TaxID=2710754 RepID=UPI002410120D|nr:MBL fold metallo-hydrolase [Rhodococcus sp. D2-41]MDG3008821.1 MBL fold metallo-hydrolase [Rhodococcus sp. D2-41]
METTTTEIAPDVYRFSTFVAEANLVMNQYLVDAEEPLLFHAGQRALFPLVSAAVARVIPLERLRWITFGHVEADECGSMNSWLAAAPHAEVAHGAVACFVQVDDLADRAPRPLQDGEVIAVGERRIRHIGTPHVPHGWDAGLVFEETTNTLLCGDLFTAFGRHPDLTESDIVGPAVAAEGLGHPTALTPDLAPTLRALADLEPTTLGLMHGPAYTGDCAGALRELAASYEALFEARTAE